jgi:hypothetical protein
VIKAENIFDLKGFFDSVDIIKLKTAMEERGIPSDIANMIFSINTKLPVGLIHFIEENEMYKKINETSEEDLLKMVKSEPIQPDPN